MSERLMGFKVDIQPEEIELINLIRVILQGGWRIHENVMLECFEITGIDKLTPQDDRTRTVIKTAQVCATMLGYPHLL